MIRQFLFKRTWDSMFKLGSPHYEANLRDLIVKDKAITKETGGKGREDRKRRKS